MVTSIMISAFVNKNIVLDSETVSYYMTEIKRITGIDYLPNIVNTPEIDIATGKTTFLANISFSALNGISRVDCSNVRIDFIYNFNDFTQNEIDEQYAKGVKILKMIIGKGNILSNRLALNIDLMTNKEKDAVFQNQVIQVLPYYRGKEIKELSTRVNTNLGINMKKGKEILNIITQYSKIYDVSNTAPKLNCHIDINTLAEDNNFRFVSEDIEEYIDEAKKIVEEIKNNLERIE